MRTSLSQSNIPWSFWGLIFSLWLGFYSCEHRHSDHVPVHTHFAFMRTDCGTTRMRMCVGFVGTIESDAGRHSLHRNHRHQATHTHYMSYKCRASWVNIQDGTRPYRRLTRRRHKIVSLLPHRRYADIYSDYTLQHTYTHWTPMCYAKDNKRSRLPISPARQTVRKRFPGAYITREHTICMHIYYTYEAYVRVSVCQCMLESLSIKMDENTF